MFLQSILTLFDFYRMTLVEYGFRQCKQELGWKDYRLTKIAKY